MSTPVISASNITKVIPQKQQQLMILEGVNIEIFAGETVAIVGSSGAGKSTLMSLLAGLDSPSSGTISLLSQQLDVLDDEQKADLRGKELGFIFQSFMLIPTLNAIENVTLPYLLQGKREDNQRALELLTSVGLQQRINHMPSELSGGEQQRVAIARAFMGQPKVLFADEPTGNLDQSTAKHIVELLFELNRQHGTTLVIITHDPSLAAKCDRQFSMHSGHLEEVYDE
ncbi:ABC transporter ATP-binding protein [Vibrio sp.]|uniref:ABC transporter ATP-binding protein n=1 Tax=Vibrio viridaestus TaxID=2487322 RepID=A0A3N9TKC6_9VIBR|nr:ABC transporter ATP-binding protein [Vibrio viridaestus]MDC0612424.1 ABC transporter ATP-binding protein [Vibrio sp.]RQW64799.1 ABC transporter ATP-binding protein [Vibrio viridaestus]